jgi:diadenylate cyclase
MPGSFWSNLDSFWRTLQSYSPWTVAFQLFLIGVVVFWLVRFLQGTRGYRLLKGIFLVLFVPFLAITILSTVFNVDMRVVRFLYEKLVLAASLAIVVVFQPEIRRALMRVGEARLFRGTASQIDREVDELIKAARFCSQRKIGALVAIEREAGLGGLTDDATRINADLSADLLNSIFYPNSPLHDLGVVISSGRIMFAGVQFPLAEAGELENDLGSRHRAAVGLSQECDAVILVVSEETGDVSIAERGLLYRRLTFDSARQMLGELLGGSGKVPGADSPTSSTSEAA